MTVRTRIAPSPTGYPHIGTIYQVLFDWAYARKNKGMFILRIEDTDRARFVEGAEDVIYSSLDWFGLSADESPQHEGKYGPYRQSERLDIYQKYVNVLIEKEHAYYCFCTRERLAKLREDQQKKKTPPMYDRHCLNLTKKEIEHKLKDKVPHVVRMKIPRDRTISFDDMIAGTIEFDAKVLDDQVILKSDGYPTYHLAVVVDDHLMNITHVLRGKEWISSTPKHVLLYEFFGWSIPKHGHMPLLLNSEGKGKLSKRHGHASVDFYIQEGYLPEAILNYLSNIVWAHPEEKEIYSLDEFVEKVDITKLSSAGAQFDLRKLDWMNGEYIRNLSITDFRFKISEYLGQQRPDVLKAHSKLLSDETFEKTLPLIQTRIKKLSEYWDMCDFFYEAPKIIERETNKKWLEKSLKTIQDMNSFDHKSMYEELSKDAEEFDVSKSKFFMDIRIAITGKKVGPPLFESMEILGKKECLMRLQAQV